MTTRTILVALGVAALASPANGEMPPMTEYDSATDAPSRRNHRDTDELGWYVPDFVRLQTGGFVGLVAVGVGYAAFDDVLNVSAHYGYTPAAHVGTTVHAMSLEVLVRPFDQRLGDFRVVPIYIGPGLLYTRGEGFFTRVPDQYAHIGSNYYPPSSLYWTARVGLELDYVPRTGFFERHGVFYEATLFSAYFNLYRKNPDTLSFEKMFGGAVGYRAAF